MATNLHMPVLETVCATIIWSGAVLYSLYSLYLFGNDVSASGLFTNHEYVDFEDGWFGRIRDISDFEWNCWTWLSIQQTPWLMLNFLAGMIGRNFVNDAECVSLCQTAISLLAVSSIVGRSACGLFIVIFFSFYVAAQFQQPLFICLIGWLWRRYTPSRLFSDTDEELYMIEVASSWLIIRCLACSFEFRRNRKSLPLLMGYAFYLPTALCGPILSFSGFVRHAARLPPKITTKWWSSVLKAFGRCFLWFLFTNLALHFIYPNAILLRPFMVVGMTLWQLAGLGIAMGHFFHLKYVVFYGLPSCWAAAEGHTPPAPPCCVSRVYLYSVMWRRFDPGLYAFLIRYIYIPIIKLLSDHRLCSKTVASIACFFFVFLWHGEEEYVLYWVLLNFTAVTVEGLAKQATRLRFIRSTLDRTLSANNQRRLHCLVAAPLHYFSMLSNYFFIGNLDIGKIYFQRAFRETLLNNLYILFFLYGAAQASLSIEILEKRAALNF